MPRFIDERVQVQRGEESVHGKALACQKHGMGAQPAAPLDATAQAFCGSPAYFAALRAAYCW
ncbi:hypothetical protein BA896_006045 [Janthinobacterium lividum]|uniref:Uncharacterized protein n=1 Tax=Janthinobacterium lividum TaxID=29581 RepID=A0A1E8PQM3_9BURK|nr:hypothetical protein BA896_006045 [Janthinobacterium lividum]